MIRTERTTHIPRTVVEKLAPYSRAEFEAVETFVPILEKGTTEILIVYEGEEPLAVLGIVKRTMLGTPDFWFLLCVGFARRHLKLVKRYVREMVQVNWGLRTNVEDVFLAGRKFIEFAGFVKTDMTVEALGRTFHTYEARV